MGVKKAQRRGSPPGGTFEKVGTPRNHSKVDSSTSPAHCNQKTKPAEVQTKPFMPNKVATESVTRLSLSEGVCVASLWSVSIGRCPSLTEMHCAVLCVFAVCSG